MTWRHLCSQPDHAQQQDERVLGDPPAPEFPARVDPQGRFAEDAPGCPKALAARIRRPGRAPQGVGPRARACAPRGGTGRGRSVQW